MNPAGRRTGRLMQVYGPACAPFGPQCEAEASLFPRIQRRSPSISIWLKFEPRVKKRAPGATIYRRGSEPPTMDQEGRTVDERQDGRRADGCLEGDWATSRRFQLIQGKTKLFVAKSACLSRSRPYLSRSRRIHRNVDLSTAKQSYPRRINLVQAKTKSNHAKTKSSTPK
jgi:hypothetical protein